ncbi:hypothetical protein AB9F39_38015, partial [Rhizobium leguminosarum]
RIDTGQRAGLGVEIVLKVADFEGAYRTAKESGWPVSDLALQPWGIELNVYPGAYHDFDSPYVAVAKDCSADVALYSSR